MLDGFSIVTRLSATRHSAVYIADRESDGERVVLKVFQKRADAADAGGYERFLSEYSLVASVDHENVVTIFDHVLGDDSSYIVMDTWVVALRHRIRAGIREREACIYLRKMASALTAVHEVGILHRDLKPGNVMFRDDGSIV